MGCAFGAEQKKSRNAALFLCAETLIGVWKYACKVFCAICIRIHSPRQSERRGLLLESDKLRAVPSAQTEKEPQAALFLCANDTLAATKPF